jgi:hypothetical protein
MVGTTEGRATVEGISDFLIVGNTILLEIGDQILLETGVDFLLLEDGASTGISAGETTVRGIGAALVDTFGTSAGIATVSGVMEEPSGPSGDTLLLEIGDDILLENDDFLLLETGAVPPAGIILDTLDQEISDTSGDFILEV